MHYGSEHFCLATKLHEKETRDTTGKRRLLETEQKERGPTHPHTHTHTHIHLAPFEAITLQLSPTLAEGELDTEMRMNHHQRCITGLGTSKPFDNQKILRAFR